MSPGEDTGDGSNEDCERSTREAIKHPEFRTTVFVGELTVTGVLPATPRLRDSVQQPEGWLAIAGDVHRLSCDGALELADALLLVVLRMDRVALIRHERR